MENSSPANNPEDLQSVQSPADSEVEPFVVVDESAPDERTSLQQVTDLHAEGNLEDITITTDTTTNDESTENIVSASAFGCAMPDLVKEEEDSSEAFTW